MKAFAIIVVVRWVLLYVERWLTGSAASSRTAASKHAQQGTPQGGVVSPILANLFLHYTFDAWVRREMPHVPFCRYADDGLLHCRSRRQAEYVMRPISERFRECSGWSGGWSGGGGAGTGRRLQSEAGLKRGQAAVCVSAI